MEELISVIVPIYKVERYLPKCLDSILQQTYQALEIILVDDGSPDSCPEICDQYAKKDPRIKVVHQENGGLSAARNRGVEMATGDFLCFVDPDDYIHPQMYEKLIHNLKKADADLSICDYYVVFEEQNHIQEATQQGIPEQIFTCTNREALSNLYDYNKNLNNITLGVWNKLYKRNLFTCIRFKMGKIHEDDFIMHHILDAAKTVVYSNISMYYYLQRNSSITGQKFNIKRLDRLEALAGRIEYFKGKGYDELYDQAYGDYLSNLIYDYYLVKKNCPEEKEVFDDLKNKFLDLYENRGNVVLRKNQKINFALFSFSPLLSRIVQLVWKKVNQIKAGAKMRRLFN